MNPAPATIKQKKMFFALCNALGHNPERAKEKAKEKFKLLSFADVTKEQANWLIDKLLDQVDAKGEKVQKDG